MAGNDSITGTPVAYESHNHIFPDWSIIHSNEICMNADLTISISVGPYAES